MKGAWTLFAASCMATVLAVALLVLVGIRHYTGARLDWFFEPTQAAGIQLGWVLTVLVAVAVAAYAAALAADALSDRKA